jgi:hypothetical protein
MLPITPHRAGRAGPLIPPGSVTAPPATPAPETAPVAAPPVPVVDIPVDTSDNPDTETALTDDATPEEIAAAAGRFRRASELARDRAERDRAAAESILETARAEADQIIADAKAKAGPLTETATGAEQAATAIDKRARMLSMAADRAAKADASAARVEALEDERETLTELDTELGSRRRALGTELRDLEAQLAVARDAADLDAMTGLRNRIDSIRDVEAALDAQQRRTAGRLQAIGDGEQSPIWPQKELREARRIADIDQHAVRGALNGAFPERPEAVADAKIAHERQLDAFAASRDAAQAAERDRAAWRARPQHVEEGIGHVTIRR